jgi:predicted  nucleic acid-binding Zn-ribbon protein
MTITSRDALEHQLEDIKHQIRSYPQPIAGCDTQYQHLFDQREALVREIRELQEEAS